MADLPILDELRHELREAGRRTATPPRRRISWRPLVAVAAAGLAALFVVVVGPQGESDHTSGQEPPANETLTHVIYLEGRGDSVLTHEQWTTADGCRSRSVITTRDKKPWGEFTSAPGETRSWTASAKRMTVAEQSPALVLTPYDPAVRARDYLRRHRSKIVGRTERNGTPMVWRQVTKKGDHIEMFLTDAKSYETWGTRLVRKGREVGRLSILTREQVPYDPELLEMSPHDGAEVLRVTRPANVRRDEVAKRTEGSTCG